MKPIILHPSQKLIAQDRHRFRVVDCGRRFGKTILAVEEMIGVAVAIKDRRISYYAPTRDDARDIVWGMLNKRCEPIIRYSNDSRLELKLGTQDNGESLITLYGWESVQERGKGRGLNNDFIVFDEVAQYRNFWTGWEEVLSPTLIDTKGSALFISTPKGFNHFYDLFNLEAKNKDFKSFKFTSFDNPHIPVEELEREKKSKTEDRFAQEYLADFRKTEGLVYKEFDRTRHISEEQPKKTTKVMAGIDWGYKNPAAVYRVREDGDRHYWIDNEFYKTNQTTEQIVEYAQTLKPEIVYPDPAEPDRLEIARRNGLNVREVSKDIVAGVDCVRELLKQGRIHIHPECKNLIWEFETYHYPDKKPDQNEKELPVKENDHALDAIRYVLFNQEPVIQLNDPYFEQWGSYYRE